MTGTYLSYWACHKIRVQCPDCVAALAAGLLAENRKTQYGVGIRKNWETPTPPMRGNSDVSGVFHDHDNTMGVLGQVITGKGGDVDRTMQAICALSHERGQN